jgi:endoglucanase
VLSRVRPRWLAAAGVIVGMLAAAGCASAGTANAGLPGAPVSDPLAGMRWGNYDGRLDEVFPAYRRATAETRRLLGLIALRPRMRWFGQWYADPRAAAREYVDNVTAADPGALVQLAVFALVPWERTACQRLPTPGEQAAYRRWIDGLAAGIGTARTALVLQPDLPFGLCAPHHSTLPLQLVAYAARVFAALPHTSVYIDVGASDWSSVGQSSWLLRHAGIRYARGFALGATHYASTSDEIRYGDRLVRALSGAGVRGRHFVVNTAQNGRPFTFQQYHGSNYDNATACRTRSSRRCVTLGIPPTTDVASRRWGLSRAVRALAAREVDAYLWIGRPWLFNQSDPFDLQRSLALARTTPY